MCTYICSVFVLVSKPCTYESYVCKLQPYLRMYLSFQKKQIIHETSLKLLVNFGSHFFLATIFLNKIFGCDPSLPVVRALVPQHESLPFLLGTILVGHPKMHVLPQGESCSTGDHAKLLGLGEMEKQKGDTVWWMWGSIMFVEYRWYKWTRMHINEPFFSPTTKLARTWKVENLADHGETSKASW